MRDRIFPIGTLTKVAWGVMLRLPGRPQYQLRNALVIDTLI